MIPHVTAPPTSPAPLARAPEPGPAPGRAIARQARGLSAALPWAGLVSVAAVSALVFWAFEALPFQDLPAHAGLIAMRHRFIDSPFEQRFFVLAPHIGPYSLFRLLGEGFDRLIGPMGAVRAIATLPVLATPLALLFARRRLHGDRTPTAGYFGIALSFGLMTLLGFASYLLGVAIMLVGLTLWLELMVLADAGDTRNKELAIAALAPLMFIAHGHAFVLFLLLAGVSCLAAGNRLRRLLRLRALIPAVSLAAWVAWIERGTTTPPGSVAVSRDGLVPHFQGVSDKLSLLLTPMLMTRSGIDIVLGVIMWTVLIAATVATVRGDRAALARGETLDASRLHSRALYVGAACLGVAFLALPHAIGWFGFVDGRLVPIVLLIAVMAVRVPTLGRFARIGFERAAPFLAWAMALLVMVASYRFQAEARGYKEILAVVPSEARLLNLPLEPNSEVFTAHPFIHYDKLVLTERPIVVSDIWFHQGSALYPTRENPALRLPSSYSESDLKVIDWPAYTLDDWDYVLIRTRPEGTLPAPPFPLVIANHRAGWWLYKNARTALP